MGWISCVRREKFRYDFVEKTFTLIAPVQPVLHQASCSNETIQNAPKHYETHQNMRLGSNGIDRCVHYEKFWCDFMARTCALITPVQPILHRVSCSNETLPNATKHYETHQNMNLESNGVDRFRSLRKIPMRLRGTNFCISCTSSTPLVSSIVQWQNNPKCIQTIRDTPKHEFRAQWGGSSAFVAKNSDATSWQKLLH